MAKGGKRPGAGRPKGAISKSTRAIIEAAEAEGKTMLEIMTAAARKAWERARAEDVDDAKRPELEAAASALADRAAPYLHHRLAAVQHSGEGGGPIQHEHNLSPALQAVVDKLAGANSR